MSEPQDPSGFAPPVSAFAGPVAELIAQRMLSPPSRPGVLASLDQFEIIRILGGGGMGVVLLARDSRGNREVAIKLIKSELVSDQQVVHRFLKEAGHLKRLRHINIVPVDEISERPEAPYFVMPYFAKGSLASRIKPGYPLETETVLDMAAQVAEGLSFAHRSGIIHRDLKPANILVSENDRVCIADFGLARTLFNDTFVDVQSRQLEGTAPYMSPAVAAGDAEDTRCDTYSYGALLYEMLTGHPPYKGKNTKEILNKILAGPPEPITTLNPRADRRLVAVAEKAMARELRDRYADMRDVLKDLEKIKDGKLRGTKTDNKNPALKYLFYAGIPVVVLFLLLLLASHKPAVQKPPQTTNAPAPVATPPPANPVVVPAPTPPPVPAITMLAGQPGTKGYADGPGAQSEFRLPNNLAVDHAGNIYVADTANDVIRKITPDGTVSTLAGMARNHGSADGRGSDARFWAPFGLAVDASGNVYVADTANNTVRKITPDGMVSTLAGLAGNPGDTDGTNFVARFRNPWGVAVDNADGDVFVADMSNNTIRRITPAGVVNTFAGEAGQVGSADGFGNDARFHNPFAVAVDNDGDVYVSDSANNAIRKITHRVVTTLAGSPGTAGNLDGQGADARFWNPQGLAVDSAGNVYVADTGNNAIRKITPMGVVTAVPIPTSGSGNPIQLKSPGGVAVDAAGNIYIADSNNQCVRKISGAK
jgi:serine/threonine protein kinase/streptogramin lyase